MAQHTMKQFFVNPLKGRLMAEAEKSGLQHYLYPEVKVYKDGECVTVETSSPDQDLAEEICEFFYSQGLLVKEVN